jgi:hypothetical protein
MSAFRPPLAAISLSKLFLQGKANPAAVANRVLETPPIGTHRQKNSAEQSPD